MQKKILLLLILLIMVTTGCRYINNNPNVSNKKVGTSNELSNNLQIKILNKYINIRKEKSTSSEILGIVKKDSVFNVLDYEKVNNYLWVHIKTNNNIDGYVASNDDNEYYEFINGNVDFTPPTIDITVDTIEVDTFNELTNEYINSIVKYNDDLDKNPKLSYEIEENGVNYYIIFKVKDKSDNSVEKKVKLVIKNERLASNNEWITYDKVRELRSKFTNIAKKYGDMDTYNILINKCWIMDFYDLTSISVFTDESWYYGCYYNVYNDEIKVISCNDEYGNISYEQMKNRIASQEKSAKIAYLKIKEEFEKTGYKIGDLNLNFG